VPDGLEALLAEEGDAQVLFALRWPDNPAPVLATKVLEAIGGGQVKDDASEKEERVRWFRARTASGGKRIDSFVASAGEGLEVVERAPFAGAVTLRGPKSRLQALLRHPDVLAASDANPDLIQPDWGTSCGLTASDIGYTINGVEMMRLNQTQQFYQDQYFGEGRYIAFTEGFASTFHAAHPSFRDDQGVSRATACTINMIDYDGDGQPDRFLCVDNGGTNTRAADTGHATATASILIGDLTRNQESCPAPTGEEPCISGPTAAVQRSGIARRARLFGVSLSSESFVSDPLNDIRVLNRSAGGLPDCDGAGAGEIVANSVFEAGVGFVKSAGNNGNSGPTCTGSSPVGAMGLFPVGDYSWVRSPGGQFCQRGINDCSTFEIDPGSSRGGYGPETRNRALISLMAPEGFQYPATHASNPTWPVEWNETELKRYRADWTTPNGEVGDPGVGGPVPVNRGAYGAYTATSSAAPQVAGLYSVFQQWYYDNISTNFTPATMYANLLLMGDRLQIAGTYGTNGLDGTTGAGLLRARTFDSVGLDAPAWYGSSSVCVPANTTVSVPIFPDAMGSPQLLPAGTAYVKAALWFYDPEFDDSTLDVLEPVETSLQKLVSGIWTDVLTTTTDNQRLFFTDDGVAANAWRLNLSGGAITSDSTCGTNAVLIDVAVLAEGNGREQGDTPECVRAEN
jgi:hypothetical protein